MSIDTAPPRESTPPRDWQTPRAAHDARAIVESIVASQGFARLLGYRVVDAADLAVTLAMPASEALLQPYVVHGGAIASLAEGACTLSVLTRLWPEHWVTTVEQSVRYLRPISAEQIVDGAMLHAFAHVRRFGKTLSFVETTVTFGGREIATAQSTQMRQPRPR
jgi:uncharacterized protein (TIGR00369 family)